MNHLAYTICVVWFVLIVNSRKLLHVHVFMLIYLAYEVMIVAEGCVDYWITDIGGAVLAPIFPSSSTSQIPINIKCWLKKNKKQDIFTFLTGIFSIFSICIECKYDIMQQLYSNFLCHRSVCSTLILINMWAGGGTAQEKRANVDLYLQNPCIGFPWVLTFKPSPFSCLLAVFSCRYSAQLNLLAFREVEIHVLTFTNISCTTQCFKLQR